METGMDSVDIPTPGGRHPRVVSPPRLSLSTPSAALRWQRPAPDTPSSAKTTFTSKTMEETQEQLWYELAEFYYRNEDTIERVMAMDIGSLDKVSQMDLAIDTFVETANLLLPGLVALANVHPGLGIAVFAFAGVIGLDITRRDNNRKVLAVKLQMQNMMCAMFQLRKLRHMHVQEPEREQEQTRLHRLIGDIAEEIKICGSDLDYYMDRKFVSKFINAKGYEHRFAQHIETFARRRSELQSTITAYIAAGVDAANVALAEVGEKLAVMDNKLDKIFHLFRNLDTPREREVHNFIEQNGGVEQCVIKDELLIKLLSQTGDFSTSGKTGVVKGQELVEIRESLRAELSEDLDEVLARNLSRFEKLLKVQNNNLKSILDHIEHQGYEILNHTTKLDKIVTTTISILEEEHHMRKAIAPILSINFKDPVLQSIWNRMGLKGSVKAKTFVLTFRDHIFADSSDPASSFASPVGQSLYTPYSDDGHSFNNNTPTFSPFELSSDILQSEIEDQWVLQYVNVGHVQPVVEAIDEDGSGFISVKEANKFAISRPKGWSFLRWIAYWAEGWHINITNYRSKLYSIVQQMHNALLSAHPANRSYVDEYLNHPSFNRLEALLRSITPLPDNAHIDSKLTEIADSMTSLLERRLVLNLTEMSYILESPATVSLVAGTGRIETWILSLLYLVLSRHLEIITLAQKYVLHEKELGSHVKSLASIFSLFDDRIHHLESIFRTHAQQDLSAQFEKFAYGMFLAPFANREKNPSENTLLTFKDNKASLNQISERPNVKAAGGIIAIGTSILTMGLGPSFEFEDIDMDSSPAPEGHTPHPLEGVWTGQCIRTNNKQIAFQGFFHCAIDPVVDGTITGHGETYLGAVEFNGEVEADEDAEGVFLNVDFRIISENYADLWCRGQYDPKTEAISGQWVIDDDSGDFPPDDNDAEEKHMDLRLPCGRFYMTRTPASVFRFRDLLDGNGAESAYNMARKRWSFAIEAIRFQTQERLRSWSFLRARTAERRKWIELTIRRELDKISLGAKAQLSEEGKDELWALRLQMHPTNGRLYDSLSMYLFKRMSFNVGPYNCDSCDRRIIFGRYQCITCMDDKLSSQIDLCADCIEKPQLSAETSFAHHISHSLIRSTHRIHECQLASMIPQARSRSERIKASFRALEGKESKMVIGLMAHWDDKAIPLSTPPKCACCNQTVSFPCWVCVACALDTFICLDCDLKRRPLLKRAHVSAAHSFDHPLLRFHDSAEVKPAELNATRLERHLQEMEMRINNALSSLSQKVDAQLDMKSAVRGSAKNPMAGRWESAPLTSPLTEVDAEMVSAAHMQEKIARRKTVAVSSGRLKKIQEDALEKRLEERLSALETKVDKQFGQLLSLIQQLVPTNSNSA